jgi:hypothetical protein
MMRNEDYVNLREGRPEYILRDAKGGFRKRVLYVNLIKRCDYF